MAEDAHDPTTPTGLTGTASPTSAVLRWQASTDDVGVQGYRVYGDGELLAEVAQPRAVVRGLTPEADIAFTVVAGDRTGNTSPPTAPLVLHTGQAPGGRPQVTLGWERPRAGEQVRGALGAGDDCAVSGQGIHHVDFLVDGSVLGTDRRQPWTCVLDTTRLPNGTHTLTAVASDPVGRTTTQTRSFVVSNAATTTVTPTGTTFNGSMEAVFPGTFNLLTTHNAQAPQRMAADARAGAYRAGLWGSAGSRPTSTAYESR